jgi:unsaturated rhamnogalacturonyl hydrolase
MCTRALVITTAALCAASLTSACNSSGGTQVASSGGASTTTTGGSVTSGGTTASSGGAVTLGGTTSSGGSNASGGAVVSGGATAKGGTSATSGGSVASGGAVSSGGTTANGGTNTSGGTAVSGGTPAKGGTTATNGGTTVGSGGASSTGGVTGAGGTSAAGGTTSTGTTVAGLPARADVLADMRSANDWFMKKHPDPGANIVTDKSRPSTLWTRATYYEGLIGLYNVETDATKKTSYYKYGTDWGDAHSWAMHGLAATATTKNADNQACGQGYIDLYNIGVALGDKQANRIAAITASIKSMVSGPTSGPPDGWWWIDAIQMSMPSFAKLGVLTGDTTYFDGMWVMYNNARTKEGGGLWNAAEGLWFRDLHFTPGGGTKTPMTATIHNNIPGNTTDAYYVAPNGKSLYWSRGNGWVFTALTRVLDILPTTDSHRPTYVADFQAMAKALVAIQRTDGFWTESLFDPAHCATIGLSGQDGPETSGTAFFVYGMAWGIREGLLDAATYGPAVQKGWNGLSTIALQSDGLLGYTQSTGDRPCTDTVALSATKTANFDDYGVGGFLLAGSEVYQLSGN